MKRKRVDKLFMDDPIIHAGWLDLNINNDVIIPVSYLNSRFFYDLLNIVCVLNSYDTIGTEKLIFDIDCEGTLCRLSFCFPTDFSCKKISECDDIKISVMKEFYDFKEDKGGEKYYYYIIEKNKFIKNILNLIKSNIDKYNKDFCCDDVADFITTDYVNFIENNLLDFLKKEK